MSHTELSRIWKAAQTTPWAILPEKLAEIRSVLVHRMRGEVIAAEEREAWLKKAEERTRARRAGSVSVLPVFGTIAQRMNVMMAMSGGTSTEILEREIRQAIADPDVSAIVLDVDSPGGTVSGLPEIHSIIMDARNQKPIVASVNSFSASAAYWITSAASEIAVTPSGEVGSIGVFAMHVDESAALEQEGVKVSLISAGKFKTEGNPFEPLTEEARAAIQADVDAYYSMFVRDVARGRGVSVNDVREKFGEGRMVLAKDAKAAGMVDRVETLNETVARLSRAIGGRRPKAEIAERRLALHDKFLR